MATYTKRGVIRVATDVSMTVVLSNPSSQFRAALEDLIEAVLSDNPAVIAAAEAAVNDALASILSLSKCVHLEAGKWVWDGPLGAAATHYVFPDHDGRLVVRSTPFPTPLATPALNW